MFESVVTWYEQQKDKDDTAEEAYIKILRASGDFKLKHKKYVCYLSPIVTIVGMTKQSKYMKSL